MWKHPLLQLLLTVPHVLSLKPVLHVFLGIEMVSAERSKVILACSNSGQVYLIVFVLMFWFRDVWEFSFCFHCASNDPLTPQLGTCLNLIVFI